MSIRSNCPRWGVSKLTKWKSRVIPFCLLFLFNSNDRPEAFFWTMLSYFGIILRCIVKDLILVIPFIIELLGSIQLLSIVSVGSRRILLVIERGFFPFFSILSSFHHLVDCSFY